ncbi:MAG TPA: nuclear transport factor 2 family protein [Pyrinomonadaceae bacterium]|nr:nuclear transport factor 2 family protein [Pyrinomonadaceae bacterium]
MQRIIFNVVVSLATFIIGVTAATPWTAFRTASDSQDKTDILKVERQYLDAHIQRDTARLERVLSEDFTFSHYWGGVTDKARRLSLLENPDFAFESIETSGVEVTVSGDTARLTGQAVVRGNYRGRPFMTTPYNYTRTYERRDGQWQIVSVRAGRYRSR